MKYITTRNFTLLAVILLVVVAGTAALVGTNQVRAIGNGQTVIDRLVERFNLNKDEVTNFFDELHTERLQEKTVPDGGAAKSSS